MGNKSNRAPLSTDCHGVGPSTVRGGLILLSLPRSHHSSTKFSTYLTDDFDFQAASCECQDGGVGLEAAYLCHGGRGTNSESVSLVDGNFNYKRKKKVASMPLFHAHQKSH